MLLGARQFFERRGGGWVNPYVMDGLVAMWDGEWNAGGGVHDPNATVWMDLSGNGVDMVSMGEPNFGQNYMTTTKLENLWHTDVTDAFDGINTSGRFAIEIVAEQVDGYGNQKLLNYGGGWMGQYGSFFTEMRNRYSLWVGSNAGGGGSTAEVLDKSGIFDLRAQYGVFGDGLKATTTFRATSQLSGDGGAMTLPMGANPYRKSVAIGFREVNSTDSPMIHGEKVYTIRIYSRALTAAEIAANYAVDKARFNLP